LTLSIKSETRNQLFECIGLHSPYRQRAFNIVVNYEITDRNV